MSRLGRPRKLRSPRRKNKSRRGVATAIGSILFFVIAFQIIAFLYEVNQVHTEMVSFDIERTRESLQFSSIGFNDLAPSSLQVSLGQVLSGDVASLGFADSNRLTLNSEELLTALHPTSYNLVGSTTLVSGGTSWLTTDDGTYMVFRSYLSSFTSSPTRAFAAYRSNTGSGPSFPKGASWDGSSWSSEQELPDSGSPVRWVRSAYSPISSRFSERVVITLSDDGYLDAFVWDGSSWTVSNDIGFVVTTPATYRAFDISYETVSGDAILVYGISSTDTTQDLAYRIWNGLSWSAEAYIDDPSISDIQYNWVQLASYPLNTGRADEIALIGIDGSGSDANAWIWDGIAWGNFQELTANVIRTTEEDIAVAYGQISGDAMFIWGSGNSLQSRKWIGSWQSQLLDVLLGGGGGAGITIDSITTNQGNTDSFTHQHTSSGSNRLLIVTVQTAVDLASVSSLTYGGQALTFVSSATGPGAKPRVEVWSLVAPPTGTNDVVVTLSNPAKTTIGAISYNGADQTAAIDGTTTTTGNSATASVTVTSESGDLVQDAMATIANPVVAPTPGAGQTQRFSLQEGGSIRGVGSTEDGASSVTMSWILPVSKEWATIGFNLNAADEQAEARWFTLKADPTSNRLMAVVVDNGNDLNTIPWDESSWGSRTEHDIDIDTDAQRPADFDWEPSGSKGLLVWGTSLGSVSWKTFTAPSTWSSTSTESNSGTHPWIQLRKNPRDISGDVRIMGATLNSDQDLYTFTWDGINFIFGSSLSTDTAGTAWEMFDLNWRAFGDPIYDVEVEFTGSGGIEASKINWIVDSSWTVGTVNVTIQLFSYANNQYVPDQSSYEGKAYLSYKSDSNPNVDESETEMIDQDISDFFDSGGNWKIKIRGEKETDTQFDIRVDLVEYELESISTNWAGIFSVPETSAEISDFEINYIGFGQGGEITQRIYIYNFTGLKWDILGQFTTSSLESSAGPLLAGGTATDYIDSSTVRISVNGTSSDLFTVSSDYLHLRVLPISGVGSMTVEVFNSGGNDIHLVDLWVLDGNNRSLWNSASSPTFDRTVFPGESYSTTISFDWTENEKYRIKVVSERGGIWSRVVTP